MRTIDFSTMYSLYYNRLFRISFTIIRDAYLAEDIVQETFIKAIKNITSVKEENKLGSWLSAIATRTAIDFLRKEKTKQGIPMDQDMLEFLGKEMEQNVEDEVAAGILSEQVNHAIKKLTFNYQEVLLLRLGKGLKESEIAYALNLKPCTVKTRIYRARRQLKLLMDEQLSA